MFTRLILIEPTMSFGKNILQICEKGNKAHDKIFIEFINKALVGDQVAPLGTNFINNNV